MILYHFIWIQHIPITVTFYFQVALSTKCALRKVRKSQGGMNLEGIQSIYIEHGLSLQYLYQVIVQPELQPGPMPSLSPPIQFGLSVSEAGYIFQCVYSSSLLKPWPGHRIGLSYLKTFFYNEYTIMRCTIFTPQLSSENQLVSIFIIIPQYKAHS